MLARRLHEYISTLTHYEDHLTLIPFANIFFPNVGRQSVKKLFPTVIMAKNDHFLVRNSIIQSNTSPFGSIGVFFLYHKSFVRSTKYSSDH